MENFTDFIKVRASLTKGLHPFTVTSNGPTFNDAFMERLTEVEEFMRSRIILPINEAVGLHNWAVRFVEHPTSTPTFFADIYAETQEAFQTIAAIIAEELLDISFSYYHKGTVKDYVV